MVESISDWLVRQRQTQQQQSIGAANIVLGATAGQNPDEVAGDLNLAREFNRATGNPTPPLPLVSEYRSVFQEAIERNRNSTALSTAPRLAEWLRDPTNAALARDDIQSLSWWERMARSFEFGNATTIVQGQEFRRDMEAALETSPLGQGLDALRQAFDNALLTNPDGTPNLLGHLANLARGAATGADGIPRQQVGGGTVTLDDRRQAILDGGLGPIYQGAQELLARMEAEGFQPTRLADVDGVGSAMQFVADQLSMSLPQMLSTAASGGYAPLINLMQLGGEANAELAERTDIPVEQRVAIATGAGVAMSALDFFGLSRVFGGAPAGDVVREAVEGTLVERLVSNGMTEAAARVLQAAIAEGSTEALQEGIVMGVTAMSGGEYERDEVMERLAEAFAGGAGAGGAMRAGGEATNVVLQRLSQQANEAEAAEQRRAFFEELSGQAAESRLRQRMPDAFRDLLDRALANGPVENVFVPAEQFAQYFQDAGVDPFAIVDALDGVTRADLETALVSGGDLRIPTAAYAARIAGTEHDAFFMDNMRFDPDQYTSAQAREFNERAQEALQEAYELAERVRLEAEELRTFEQEIYDTMVSRLREAGRSTEIATNEAMLWPAFYRVMAERANLTIEEFMQRYPLPQVRGDLPQGMRQRDVSVLMRTIEEARARRTIRDNRQSLLEFIADRGGINDVGGELRARDAEVVRRDRGRRQRLRLSRSGFIPGMQNMFGGGSDFGPDSVARAAIEAGFMADDPIVQQFKAAMERGDQVPDITAALWDAIDRELAGELQFSEQSEADPRIAQMEALDQVEEYLSSLGVSLDDDNETIMAAIEADWERSRQYGQSGSVPDFSGWPLGKISTMIARRLGATKTGQGANYKRLSGDDRSRSRYYRLPDGRELRISDHDSRSHVRSDIDVVLDLREGVAEITASGGEPVVLRVNEGGGWVAPEGMSFDEAAQQGMLQPAEPGFDGDGAAWSSAVMDEIYRAAGIRQYSQSQRGSQTDSEAFKRWFGDSKVVDADGKPLVVYHGTATEFEAFDQNFLGSSTQATSSMAGFFFTSSKRVADSYANYAATSAPVQRLINEANEAGDRGDWDTYDRLIVEAEALESSVGPDTPRTVVETYLSMQNPLVFDAKGENPDGIGGIDPIIQRAIAEGRDGVILRNLDDAAGLYDETADHFIVFEPTQIKSVNNRGTFDPNDPRIMYQGDDARRGSIQLPLAGVADGETVINLFQSADLSTFLHESGHYFLAVMRDLAARGEGNAAADLDAVRAWWRDNAGDVAKDATKTGNATVSAEDVTTYLDDGTTGDLAKDMAIDIGLHEQWARGFEAYLMEGKAPSVELRTAFEKFRAWLISVYRRLLEAAGMDPARAMGANVSPELRAVFDRMLASDAEIQRARAQTGSASPIFATAEQMGLTQEEYDAYLRIRSQAEDEAKARLMAEVMAPLKRERDKAYRAEKQRVRDEVARQVNAMPVYRAYEWLGNGRWLGDGQPEALPKLKLSRAILVERYGEGVLKTLSDGRRPVYSVEGGADPDDVAGWFGFGSGDELVRAIERAQPRNAAIDAETERVMRELHGDALNDGSIELLAIDAVHSERHADWIAAELKAVSEIAGVSVGLTVQDARNSARRVLAGMKVRDAMAANRFLAAERKAADEAQRLSAQLGRESVWMRNARRRIATKARAALREDATPDAAARQIEQANRSTGNYNETVQKLIDAKRRQLLNHALYMESRKVADEVASAERFVARLGKKSTRERIAGAGRRDNAQIDYLSAIDEILDRYDFRRMSGAAERRRGALAAFIRGMVDARRENELAIPDHVMSEAASRPYKTLSVEELRGVVDSLKNLEHVATRWNKLIDAQRERDLSEVVEGITEEINQNIKGRAMGRFPSERQAFAKKWPTLARKAIIPVLTAQSILREIDGLKDLGRAYMGVAAPIDEAMGRVATRRLEAAKKLEDLKSVYSREEQRDMNVPRYVPALGRSVTKWEMIALALNTGNEGNFERLTDQRGAGFFTPAQVEAVLASLDARDADFIQSVWDYIDGFWPEIEALERRQKGVAPEKVEPRQVVIGGKTLKGGYYPIRYDSELSGTVRNEELSELDKNPAGGRFANAHTRQGHRKARTDGGGRPIMLDMSVLYGHVNQVLYDIEMSEPVQNAWRVVQRLRPALEGAGRHADFEALELWVRDMGVGQINSGDDVSRAFRTLRTNFTMAKLAFNLSTVAVQVTGVAQSMVVVGKKNFAKAAARYFSDMGNMQQVVTAKSSFMRERKTTFHKDIYDMRTDPATRGVWGRWKEFRNNKLAPAGLWLMTRVQFDLVDMPTWIAAYETGMREFSGDEEKAILHADGVVKRAQASGLFSDRSGIERGTLSSQTRQQEWVRMFTTLGGYMFTKFRVARERTLRAGRVIEDEGLSIRSAQEAISWTIDMAFLFTLEAVLYAAIKGHLPDEDDDDEGDGLLDEWAAFIAQETTFGVLGTMPFVRDVVGGFQGFSAGTYASVMDEFTRPFQQAFQGEADLAFWKSVINATGVMAGAPSSQINRMLDAEWRRVEGEDVSPFEYAFGRSGR